MATNNNIPSSITVEGKEITMWAYGQLLGRNKEKLRSLALDLRDIAGMRDRLSAPPRHDEDLRNWILAAQCELTGLAPEDFGMPKMNAQGMPMGSKADRAPRSGGTSPQEDGTPHDQARRAREMARDRDRGSNLFGDDSAPADHGTPYTGGRGRGMHDQQQQRSNNVFGEDLGGGYPAAGGPPVGRARGGVPVASSSAEKENQAAYLEAKRGSQLAKDRNRGSSNIVSHYHA